MARVEAGGQVSAPLAFPPLSARAQFMAAVSEAAGVVWDVLAPGAPRAELLTPEEAAAELRCSPSAIRKMCGSGQIKASRVGKLWRVSRAELEKLKARR